jgi:hypothetical protein
MGSHAKEDPRPSISDADGEPVLSYERPVLTPVGNLHDLLAAGGTQNSDPGGSCQAGGTFFDPTC